MNRFAVTATSAAIALGLLLVACVALLPGWIVGDAALPVADRLRAENDVRATLLQGLAGLLADRRGGAALPRPRRRAAGRLRAPAGALAAGPRG